MGFTDIFNTSFFILLGICFIVIGLVGYYFTQIISQQNKKMEGMVDLVSTTVDELNLLKSIIKTNNRESNLEPQMCSANYCSVDTSNYKEDNSFEKKSDLIAVSDGEEDDDDEEDDDEDDDEEEDDDDEDDDDEEQDDEQEEKQKDDVRIINFLQKMNEQAPENELENEIEELEDDTLEEEDSLEEEDTLEEDDSHADKDSEMTEVEEKVDFKLLKKLDVDILETVESKSMDYKKLSLEKLKSIAVEKNVENASKMKKNDLIKVLENL